MKVIAKFATKIRLAPVLSMRSYARTVPNTEYTVKTMVKAYEGGEKWYHLAGHGWALARQNGVDNFRVSE